MKKFGVRMGVRVCGKSFLVLALGAMFAPSVTAYTDQPTYPNRLRLMMTYAIRSDAYIPSFHPSDGWMRGAGLVVWSLQYAEPDTWLGISGERYIEVGKLENSRTPHYIPRYAGTGSNPYITFGYTITYFLPETGHHVLLAAGGGLTAKLIRAPLLTKLGSLLFEQHSMLEYRVGHYAFAFYFRHWSEGGFWAKGVTPRPIGVNLGGFSVGYAF